MLFALLAGCQVALPADAILCSEDGSCPDGWRCDVASNRCLLRGAEPPDAGPTDAGPADADEPDAPPLDAEIDMGCSTPVDPRGFALGGVLGELAVGSGDLTDGVVVGGSTLSDVFRIGCEEFARPAGMGIRDGWVAKILDSGEVDWFRRFGGPLEESVLAMDVDRVGTTVLAGTFAGSLTFPTADGTTTLESAGGEDVFVWAVSSAGEGLWAVRFGGTGSEGLGDVVAVRAEVCFSGNFQDTVTFADATIVADGIDGYVACVAARDGRPFWWTSSGGSGAQTSRSLTVEGDDLWVSGQTAPVAMNIDAEFTRYEYRGGSLSYLETARFRVEATGGVEVGDEVVPYEGGIVGVLTSTNGRVIDGTAQGQDLGRNMFVVSVDADSSVRWVTAIAPTVAGSTLLPLDSLIDDDELVIVGDYAGAYGSVDGLILPQNISEGRDGFIARVALTDGSVRSLVAMEATERGVIRSIERTARGLQLSGSVGGTTNPRFVNGAFGESDAFLLIEGTP